MACVTCGGPPSTRLDWTTGNSIHPDGAPKCGQCRRCRYSVCDDHAVAELIDTDVAGFEFSFLCKRCGRVQEYRFSLVLRIVVLVATVGVIWWLTPH